MDPRAGRRLRWEPCPFFEGLIEELLAFARESFRLGASGGDGVSLEAHHAQAEKTMRKLGKVATGPAAPESPRCPVELEYLWNWFFEMSQARGCGFGPNPIGFGEIAAWCQLTGTDLNPWEVSVIRRLDVVCLEIANARLSRANTPHK